jgi:hypothetical protein
MILELHIYVTYQQSQNKTTNRFAYDSHKELGQIPRRQAFPKSHTCVSIKNQNNYHMLLFDVIAPALGT